MKRILTLLLMTWSLAILLAPYSYAADPLRVFIRSGPKSHGPGAHDYPQFLKDWVPLLNERGAKATGGEEFPTKEQLDATDVLILHAQEAGNINVGTQRKNLLEFLQRGGGLVVIHAGAVSRDPDWFRSIAGGSWREGTTKWLEGPMHLYFTDRDNPITRDCSNWAMDDEIYYDMDLLPEVRVLAGAYTPKASGGRNADAAKRAATLTEGGKKVSIYDIQPQMWTYERTIEGASTPYRAFVSLPGHYYSNFSRPNYRAILLRGIAWAGKRENAEELCRDEEKGDNLRYVEGGPTRPTKAADLIELHPDFELSLVASEPLINKPMNVDWDEKGRLWVAETPEYPNGRRLPVENTSPQDLWKDSGSITPGKYDREAQDRISILTDTNGDGVMDTKKIFADKLELVTSFVFYRQGVIACAAPDIWYLEDTDGDDVADKRTQIYTGLGTGDTHAVMNNMRWGQDGWIYATHGYSAGDVTAVNASANEPTRIGSGVVRFRPDGTKIEQYSSKNGNTWGLNMTWDGQCFWTQPTSGTVFFHTVLPEYVLAKGKMPGITSFHGMITKQQTFPLMSWPEQAYVQIDQVGAFTAAAGCAIYEGGAWPAKWNYSYFTTEPTLNIVHHQFVKPEGVTYTTEKEKGREETEFMRSKDLWFRPIENRVGPDGALYVVDFYNQAVIHNDTRGPKHGSTNAAIRPDRDHYFGRIWKVQHKKATKLEVPTLDPSKTADLVQTIKSSPNQHVKQNAWRLIQQQGDPAVADADLAKQIESSVGSAPYRAYRAAAHPDSPEKRAAIIQQFAAANDDWTRSALIAAASDYPVETIAQAMTSEQAGAVGALVAELIPIALQKDASIHVAQLIQATAQAPTTADSIKPLILQAIASKTDVSAEITPELAIALKQLLADPKTSAQVLPMAKRWDQKGLLTAEVQRQLQGLSTQLLNTATPIEERITAAQSLIAVGGDATSAASKLLGQQDTPPKLSSAIIRSLDAQGYAEQLVATFDQIKGPTLQAAFDAILKRPEATLALLAAVEEGKINPSLLGPGNIARLRTHPNRQVSQKANSILAKLVPDAKAKNELIARLTPEVSKPGNAANGKIMFSAACAVCHKYDDLGVRDVGPPLSGMGAHGPAELLVHIVDPNREVDPSFWQWNITTKKGDSLAGVIVSENASSVTLRNQGGDVEVKKTDIANRENTHRSLMPEGLEGLGAESLRDLLTYICGTDNKYRVLDLRNAYTADARRGLFAKEEETGDSVFFAKFGNVTAESVPFFLMDPAKSATGNSLIVLKGGGKNTVAATFPQKVEITTDVTAKRLHLLSGIAGWGWPSVKEPVPAIKVTITHADGQTEVVELLNGVAIADYNREIEVPGSKLVPDLMKRGQIRLISLDITKPGPITKITLESYDNGVTPVIAAITADIAGEGPPPQKADASKVNAAPPEPKEGGKGDGKLPPVAPISWEAGKTKVLVVGGGSSHDFGKFFGGTDVATLQAAGFSVNYTEDRDQAAESLAQADVAIVSVNRQFFDTPAWRKALFAFADSGKGLIMLHPGTWYGYARWPELNAKLVGGGSRGHDRLGPYQVHVTRKDHAIMIGVPHSFEVVDELYYMNAEPDKIPEGTSPIEVLAETSPSQKYGKPHPSVWITDHPKSRIVGIALGHDARTHEQDAYKAILVNAVKWAKQ